MTRRDTPALILVVDDSAIVREKLREVIETDGAFRVETAADPFDAVKFLRQSVPSAIVLDVEMPGMDGLTFLRKLMRQHPLPVVLCTNHVQRGLTALELGAIEVIAKPDWNVAAGLKSWGARFRESLHNAIGSGIGRRSCLPSCEPAAPPASTSSSEIRLTADAVLPRMPYRSAGAPTDRLIVVGASTGGVQAIQRLLSGLPADAPGVVVVQHMPPAFTTAFAQRLDQLPTIAPRVVEAHHGDLIARGLVQIVPGSAHGIIRRAGHGYRLELADGPPVNRHRPSVDVLFRSAAQAGGPNAVGILLTGMGADGAAGLAEMNKDGALTVAQDESTSVVFGMPREAIRLGAAKLVLPLDKIAASVLS